MSYKLFSHIFLRSCIFILLIIFSFSLLVDPYNVTRINLLNIKHKLTRDGRLQKVTRIKKLKNIDNLILGSSRSERLNPETVSKIIGGYTYTFGIGGANVEDALGLLLYLEKQSKLPKNIILCIDFSGFSKDFKIADEFYKIPEINFLHSRNMNQNYTAKLFSLDAFRNAIGTMQVHIEHIEPDAYINDNGFLISRNQTPSGDINNIHKIADEYYTFNYKEGKVEFSEKRFQYFKQIVSLCIKHKINLHVMLTPVHISLYKKIQNNPLLFDKFTYVKKRIAAITPYYDAMAINQNTTDDNNFEDAVHYNEEMGNWLLHQLLSKTK